MNKLIRIAICYLLPVVCGLLPGCHSAWAQLRSVGPVPADLRMTYEELFASDLKRAKDYVGGRVKNKDDVRRSSYYISKMMAGGRIVYGDEVTRMVERIADTLLAGYPDLRRELRFYTVLSPDVNAFATAQGMVFVNAGLVAQVENEAQLAYILSHEIVHYYRSHGLEKMVGKKKGKDDVEQGRTELNEFLRRHSRSREMEAEADSLGLAMFYLPSPYVKEVDGVFDVLQYGSLPFDDMAFDRALLDAPHYRMADDCWLDSVSPISSRDDYDDSRSTHPNLLKRRQAARSVISGQWAVGSGQRFVTIGAADFARVQHAARLECVRQEIIYGEYSRAFYEAYLLCRQDKDDRAARRLLAQALYSTAKFRNRGITDVTGDYKRVEGEVQQVYYMLRRIESRQLSLLAVRKLWEWGAADGACRAMAEDLMQDLAAVHKMTPADFLNEEPGAVLMSDTTAADEKGLTKYERIKRKRAVHTEQNPASYAFTGMLSDTAFRRALSGERRVESGEWSMGSGSQLVFSPAYRVVNGETGELKADKSARREGVLVDEIVKVGKRFGIQSVDFSDLALKQVDSDTQYNDFVTANEWMGEFWQTKGEFPMLRLTQPAMNDLAGRYGAELLNLTVVANRENTKIDNWASAAWYFWPYAPSAIYSAIADHEQTATMSLLVDVVRGTMVGRSESLSDHDDTRSLLASAVYDSYRRAKKHKDGASGIAGRRMALSVGAVPAFYSPYVRPMVSAEYAIGKRGSLALGYVHGFESTYPEDAVVDKRPQFNLGYRRYTRTDFAPLGHYWGAGLVLFSDLAFDSRALGVSFDFGRNYAFAGCLLANVNLRYSITRRESDMFLRRVLANALLLSVSVGVLPF